MIHPLSNNYLKTPINPDPPINDNFSNDLKNKSVGIFTIGPVQSFISSAKKTKDFWAGSYLLSYLTWTALRIVIEESVNKANSIIFPEVYSQPLYKLHYSENSVNKEELKLPTLPNRFMVLLNNEESVNILKNCENAVRDKLNDIIDFIIKEENIPLNTKDKIKNQIDNLLEIYWISVPFEHGLSKDSKKGESNNNLYSMITSLSEGYLGSRKNLRNFKQQKEEGHKCYVCGEREGLIVDKYLEEVKNKNSKKLCGVCLLKRYFDKYFIKEVIKEEKSNGIPYPSVVEIATMDYKKKIIENANEKTLKKLVDFFKNKLNKDYDNGIQKWFIKKFNMELDRSSPKMKFLGIDSSYLDIEGGKLNEEDVKIESEWMELLKKLSITDNGKKIKFNKYYALICLDGDSMGKWVSGEMIEKAKKEGMSPKLHYLVSKSLTNYTKHVKEIFEKRKGVIVYAGGDDVVAFVNLEDLFDVMRELMAYFSGYINEHGEVDYSNDGIIRKNGKEDISLGKKASVSVGVCIAHYKKPLRLVIKKAREMEKMAKNHKSTIGGETKEKNAFAIAVLKNSGEVRTASLKWRYPINNGNYIDTIESCIKPLLKLFNDEKLSKGYPYTLKEELSLISSTNNDELIKSEIKRISKRKIIENNKQKREEYTNQLNSLIDYLYDSCKMDDRAHAENLHNFIAILEIISFIGRRGD